MVSTVRYNDEVVHKTYCLTFLQGHKNLDSFHFVQWMLDNAPGGFDSIGVTLFPLKVTRSNMRILCIF